MFIVVKVDSGEVFEGICFQCNIFSTFLSGSLHLSCADFKGNSQQPTLCILEAIGPSLDW